MDEENVPTAFGRRDGTKQLFNNSEMSDVRFLVDGKTLYGHKQILGLGSPVFKSMFFGELKEGRDVIEVSDLTSVGFKNALKYIYGFEIDFKLSELYESYMAADKYLVHEFQKDFFEYIKSKLSAENSCLIYDQLIKIGEREELTLAHVRTWIMESSKATFESENFTQIDQETLISLLSLNELNIAESDLLAAVSKWVDCEVQRQGLPVNDENRRRVFKPIKGYIVFTALTPEQIANGKEVGRLLTYEERGSLALHFLHKNNPSMIELKTSRNAEASDCSVLLCKSDLVEYSYLRSISRKMYLSANRAVDIQLFETVYSGSAANLSLKIRNSDGVDLGFKPESSLKDGKWRFSFERLYFRMEPNYLYTLIITGDEQLMNENLLSKKATFDIPRYSLVFKVGPNSDHHFLYNIFFTPPSD